MTLAPTRELVGAAVSDGRAVAAFNVISLEHAEAIVGGAEAAGTGALLQLSENAVKYHGNRLEPLVAACRELALASAAPIGIHLDHIEDLDLVDRILSHEQGIGSIMFDASTLDYAENVRLTTSVAARAHDLGLWVEAELGAIGGKDGAHAPGVRTDPDEAAVFVAATGVDGLAVAVGSSHAMLDRSAALDLELIARLAAAVNVPLVLHGSSGVPDADIARAVAAGIRKVNIGTALNVAWTTALRADLAANPDAVDPRKYSRGPRDAMARLVEHLCGVVAGARPLTG